LERGREHARGKFGDGEGKQTKVEEERIRESDKREIRTETTQL
jgi:hypothetical protein